MPERPGIGEYIAASLGAMRVISDAIILAVPDDTTRERLYWEIYSAARRMEPVADPDDPSDSVATFLDGVVGVYSEIDPYDR